MLARLLRTIASRVRDELDSSSAQLRNTAFELGRNNTNLKTVAVLPVSRHVPIDTFARKLKSALEEMGARTSYLNQASVSGHLGRHAFSKVGKLKAAAWLADQEQRYRTVLYVADSPVNSPWTQTCIRQVRCCVLPNISSTCLMAVRPTLSWLLVWETIPALASMSACSSRLRLRPERNLLSSIQSDLWCRAQHESGSRHV